MADAARIPASQALLHTMAFTPTHSSRYFAEKQSCFVSAYLIFILLRSWALKMHANMKQSVHKRFVEHTKYAALNHNKSPARDVNFFYLEGIRNCLG